ncbi:hypothetical protein [Taibaiella koreensis]|uniref:hypothetical protein n=1 Tax=Taibaiella koreensis TaxID=1268548 RepID=UPI000E59FB8A|nr:hypothetical protein [Taibaiella koreensis]
MKKILFVAGIALTSLSVAFAQEMKQDQKMAPAKQDRATEAAAVKRSPERMAQHRVERLDKELTLSADQKQKLNALFVKEATADNGRAIQRKETETQLKAILTPEQNQKYEAVKADRQKMMMQRRQQTNLDQKPAPASEQKQ